MKCPLCGYNFDEAEARNVCQACFMNRGCELIICPNCNYEFPKESKTVNFIKKLFRIEPIDDFKIER
jgi:rubredoxin